MTSPPSSPPSWVILGSVARVCAADADLPPGADLSLALAPPPRVSILTVPPRLFPDAPTARNFPAVLAADPSGLLLLHANQGRATGPLVIDRPGLQQFGWREFVGGYFVLDAASASAFAIPEPELISERTFVGLLLHPGGGGRYVVAELQPIVGRHQAFLFCFSSDVGEWVQKVVPMKLPHRLWVPAAVLAHHGRLWWADLSFGLINCDPFADAPVLAFVPLPAGKALRYGEAAGVLDRYRAVGLSAGKLRFVDMYRNRDRRGALKVGVATRLRRAAGASMPLWKGFYETSGQRSTAVAASWGSGILARRLCWGIFGESLDDGNIVGVVSLLRASFPSTSSMGENSVLSDLRRRRYRHRSFPEGVVIGDRRCHVATFGGHSTLLGTRST